MIRKGLLVNKESHVQPQRRNETQELMDALYDLGDRHQSVKKSDFKAWLIEQYEPLKIDYIKNIVKGTSSQRERKPRPKKRQSTTSESTSRSSATFSTPSTRASKINSPEQEAAQ